MNTLELYQPYLVNDGGGIIGDKMKTLGNKIKNTTNKATKSIGNATKRAVSATKDGLKIASSATKDGAIAVASATAAAAKAHGDFIANKAGIKKANGSINANSLSKGLTGLIKNPFELGKGVIGATTHINVDKHIDTFKNGLSFESNPLSMLICSALFILYAFLDLMDMNTRVLTYNILTPASTTQSTLVFSYLTSYYIMILKIIINLLTVYVLLSIIAIVLVTLMDVFMMNKNITEQNIGDDKVTEILKTLSTYTLGFIIADSSMPKWIFIFLILIPILITFSVFATSRFYIQSSVLANEQQGQIMQTFHDTNMFIVVVLVSAGILYMLFTYQWNK